MFGNLYEVEEIKVSDHSTNPRKRKAILTGLIHANPDQPLADVIKEKWEKLGWTLVGKPENYPISVQSDSWDWYRVKL